VFVVKGLSPRYDSTNSLIIIAEIDNNSSA